jgi:hypothetical protein
MNMTDTHELLSSLLADWHRWARGYQHAAGINSSPMFRECRSNHRQWATLSDLADEDKSHIEVMDGIIMAMVDIHRTALQIQARNLCTGRTVWTSLRLPEDPIQRGRILAEARESLTRKLMDAGVL